MNPQKATDALIRHQVYVEGVKNFHRRAYDKLTEDIIAGISIALLRYGVDNMGDLSKKKLRMILMEVSRRVGFVHDKFIKAVMSAAKQFGRIDRDVVYSLFSATGYAQTIRDSKAAAAQRNNHGFNVFWGGVLNAVVPGIGLTMGKALQSFRLSTVANILKIVRQGYADNLTPVQTIALIARSNVGGRVGGYIDKAKNQAHAIIETIIQHVSSAAVALYGATVRSEYEWVSVLDSRTTVICESRDGNRYEYGKGPLPPAHYNCRSTTVPVLVSAVIPRDYAAWMKKQPRRFLADVVGTKQAQGLANGTIPFERFEKFVNTKSLTNEQFKKKTELMLA